VWEAGSGVIMKILECTTTTTPPLPHIKTYVVCPKQPYTLYTHTQPTNNNTHNIITSTHNPATTANNTMYQIKILRVKICDPSKKEI